MCSDPRTSSALIDCEVKPSGEQKSILIVFATLFGQRLETAHQLAKELLTLGHRVTLFRADREDPPWLKRFDGVIIGAPTYKGRYPTPLVDYVKRYRDQLTVMPSAFFSVSLGAANNAEQDTTVAAEHMKRFFAQTHWLPCRCAVVPGTLPNSSLKRRIQFIRRLIPMSSVKGADTRNDCIHTSLNDLQSLVRQVDTMLQFASERKAAGQAPAS